MEFLISGSIESINYAELINAFPNNYIPPNPTDEYLADLGVVAIKEVVPTIPDGHTAIRNGIVSVNGEWFQDWIFTPIPEEELAAQLITAKIEKNAYINSERLRHNQSYFSYLGKHIACDPLSRSDIDATNGYVSLFGQFQDGWAGGWKCTDNSYVSLTTIDEWKDFYKAMVTQGSTNFTKSQSLKALLEQATTLEQVSAINW